MDIPTFQHLLDLFPQLPACSGCSHYQANTDLLALWGWSHGLHRYRCKVCLHTCPALTTTLEILVIAAPRAH
ncbi:transposase (fragment) [Aeromonas veronii]|uniref:Transposase n=1 Tax=Aeromonas veronii TaxID=654 RepID=A0A653L548_AERVE